MPRLPRAPRAPLAPPPDAILAAECAATQARLAARAGDPSRPLSVREYLAAWNRAARTAARGQA